MGEKPRMPFWDDVKSVGNDLGSAAKEIGKKSSIAAQQAAKDAQIYEVNHRITKYKKEFGLKVYPFFEEGDQENMQAYFEAYKEEIESASKRLRSWRQRRQPSHRRQR